MEADTKYDEKILSLIERRQKLGFYEINYTTFAKILGLRPMKARQIMVRLIGEEEKE